MNTPFLDGQKVTDKHVLVRLDLDLPPKGKSYDDTRLEDGLPTLNYLLKNKAASITIIAHHGRPEGKVVKSLSLKPIEAMLRKHFSKEQNAIITIKENLRFDPREEKDVMVFAKELAKGMDLYVNDAFASSHRNHTSITVVPKILPTVLGFQFQKEIEMLHRVTKKAKRPVIAILGGAKLSTKLPLLEKLQTHADVILVGGKMAVELQSHPIVNRKLIVAQLDKTGKDIDQATIDQFGRFIAMAKTILWNGPMGMYEDRKYRKGTHAVAEAVSKSTAFTLAGGGDTEECLDIFGLTKKLSFVSSGGGAMMEYLVTGTLPGIDAAEHSPKL